MAHKFDRERIVSSEQVYSVFREAVLRDYGVYSKQLHDEGFVGSREDANRMLSSLEDLGILEKGKRTRAQYYDPDYESIREFLSSLFNSDVSLPLNFIRTYIIAYVKVNESARIREMFTSDLVTFLRSYSRRKDEAPAFVTNFLSSLGDEAELLDRRADIVDFAIQNDDLSVADLDDFDDWLSG